MPAPSPIARITSCGILHAAPPPAHLTLNLRDHFKDPFLDPSLRQLTAQDEPVRTAVARTPGIRELVEAAAQTILAYRSGPGQTDVQVTAYCGGGRHCAPTFAEMLAERLRAYGQQVHLFHRDIDLPIVDANGEPAARPDRPATVCLCGSMRFHGEMQQIAAEETLAGRIVVMPFVNTKAWPTDQAAKAKATLDRLHLAKIEQADEVLIVGDYIGDSTRAEISYARRLGKRVRFTHPAIDPARAAIGIRRGTSA